MNPEIVDKEDEVFKGDRSDSPLRKLLINPLFDAFILVVIVINCIFMALSNPRLNSDENDEYYIEIGSYFFNIIFVVEMILKLIGYGPVKYFGDRWNMLDFIVAIVCLLDLLSLLIIFCANAVGSSTNIGSSSDVTKFLRVVRILRILRALRTVTIIPSIMVYASALSECIDKVLISALLLGIVLLGMGFISYYRVGDNLLYRCVPSPTASVSALMADDYYAAYGNDYFYSKYNINFCGGFSNTNACSDGFECSKIDLLQYGGIGADFSTPYRAFVSNFAFLTMRGWPNIFWAIVDTTDISTAIIIVLLIIICGNMMIFNLLPATFIVSLKTSQETEVLVDTLTQYPGDLDSVSELDLRIWANANRSRLSQDHFNKQGNRVLYLLGTYLSKFYSKYISSESIDIKTRQKISKKYDRYSNLDKIDIGRSIHYVTKKERSDMEDELDQLKNTTDVTGYMCVPSGHIAARWRKIITNELGYFNIFMLFCIVGNIIVLSLEKSDMSSAESSGVDIANQVFTSIFLAELVLKLGILGPQAYFSSGWNVVDFFVVVTSVPVLFGSSNNKLMTNFRIIRFLRFAKLVRISKLIGAVSKIVSTLGEIDAKESKTSISLTQLIHMIGDTAFPIINTATVLMLLIFIFSLLGMQLFVLSSPPNDIISVNYTSYNQSIYTPLINLEQSITSGNYLDRMNWDNFANAYVTMFNISLLNGWYYVMTDCIRTSGGFVILFFLVFIFLSNYFLLATLLSSVSAVMEEYGKNKLSSDAFKNQQTLTNYTILLNKLIVKAYFLRLKQNTSVEDEAQAVKAKSAVSNINLGLNSKKRVDDSLEASEEKQYIPWYRKIYNRRLKYSLFLFSPDNILRKFCNFSLKTSLFKVLVSIAVIVNLLDLVREGKINGRKIDHYEVSFSSAVYWVTLVIFYVEMILKVIAFGFIGVKNAYFYSYFHWLDIVTNIAMLTELFVEASSGFAVLRVFRVIKIPTLIKNFSGSNSLTILMDSMKHSIPSVISVLIAALLLSYFSAIVGLQIWVSNFGSCSYDGYPGGRSIHDYSFPYTTGCDGYDYVNNTIDGTEVYENLHWTPYVDNFDNIFAASRTIFRIVFQIEFQSVIYNSMDISTDTSKYVQPIKNSSGENFLFFFIVFILSSGVTVLTIAVIYFHFYVNSAKHGRKAVFGSLMSFWAGYEEKLRAIKPLADDTQINEIKSWRSFTREFPNTWIYKSFWGISVVGPAVLIVTKYQQTYQMTYFLQVDCYISLLYLLDYIFFLMVKKKGKCYILSSAGRQHFISAIYLIAATVIVLGTIYMSPNENFDDNASIRYLVLVAVIVRLGKLGTIFQDMAFFMRILQMSLSGFLPLAAYMMIVVLTFSVFCQLIFGNISPEWGNEFHNRHFNFKSFNNTWVLLFSVGTGNIYSEIIHAYAPFLSQGMNVLLEFILCSFAVIFYVLLRCFAIMVISKYLMHYSGSLGLAGEQARQVQVTWKAVNRKKKKINYDRFLDFLVKLPAPLGLNGSKVCYLDLSRFAKRVLVCMPNDVSKLKDSKNDRQLFTEASLFIDSKSHRLDERSKIIKKTRRKQIVQADGSIEETVIDEDIKVPGTEDLKFSFRQVNIAVHKAYILKQQLSDDFAFNMNRIVHQNRVREFRLQMIRLLSLAKCDSNLFNSQAQKGMIAAVTNMSLLQRIDKLSYRTKYFSIMENTLNTLKRRVFAFGFAGIDFFNLSIMRKSIVYECNAIELQLKLQKKISVVMSDDPVTTSKVVTLQRYFEKMKRLEQQINNIYFENINLSWDTSVLKEVKKIKLKSTVTAIAIDNNCNVFVAVDAISSKKGEESKSVESSHSQLKFFRAKLNLTSAALDESTSYNLVQTIDLGYLVRCMAVTHDGKRLFVGCGPDIILFSVPMSKGARAPGRGAYRESMKFFDHTASVNKIVIFNQYIISGGNDGVVNMWNFRNDTPIQTVNVGSPIFSLCSVRLNLLNVTIDDIILSDIVVAGCANGRLVVLPLPLNQQNVDVSVSWSVKYFDTYKNYSSSDTDQIKTLLINVSPVTAIATAWNFLYTGFADGSIVAWYVEYNQTDDSNTNLFNSLSVNSISDSMKQIQQVNLKPIFKSAVHTGPITSLQYVGGHLFSMSQDLSIVPWLPPENILATSKNDFTQTCGNGYVTHFDPIISAASNKMVLVTSDEGGIIKFSGPNKIEELLKIEGKDDNVSELVHFSFLEYNFQGCFTSHQGVVTEDIANLKISNKSHSPINVRVIIPKSNVFKVFIMESQLAANGSRLVEVGSKRRVGIAVDPLGVAPLQISFSPSSEIDYDVSLQFLINEIHIVNVRVFGHGVKPKIKLEKVSNTNSDRFIDFGSVKLDHQETLSIWLKNLSTKDIFCHFLEPYYLDSSDDDNTTVVSRTSDKPVKIDDKILEYGQYGCDFKFSNRSFDIPAKVTQEIRITFRPTSIRETTFNIPLKIYYCGALYTLGTIRGRSVAPKDQEILWRQSILDQKRLISQKYNLFASTIDSKSEKSEAGFSEESKISTEQTSVMQAGGLRELRTWESVLNSNFVPGSLDSFGWKMIKTDNRAIIMHDASGQFIDLPRLSLPVQNDASKRNVVEASNDSLKIDYTCDQDTIYELYFGHVLLHKGEGTKKCNTTVLLSIDTIYNICGSKSASSIGYLVLELFVYKPKVGKVYCPPKNDVLEILSHKYDCFKPGFIMTEERQNRSGIDRLLYMTKIKTVQGFTIHRPGNGDMTQQLQFVPRLVVIGFEKVVSLFDCNRGYVSEVFAGSAALQKSTATSSMFAPTVVNINQTRENISKSGKSGLGDDFVEPSHFIIMEETEGYKKIYSKKLADQKSNNVVKKSYTAPEVAFYAGKVRESMILNRPRLRMKLDEKRVCRSISITAHRKDVNSPTGESTLEVYKMIHSCHTAIDINDRAEKLEIPGTGILPRHVRNGVANGSEITFTHDLRVRVISSQPSDNEDDDPLNEMAILIDKICAGDYIHDGGCKWCKKVGHNESNCGRKLRGEDKTELKLSPLFNNKWFFVLDKSNVRLISSHSEGVSVKETTEILFHYAGVIVTNIAIPHRLEKVVATRHGQCALVKELKDLGKDKKMSYLYKPSKETLTKISEHSREAESRAESLELPRFVNEYWTQFVKANFLKQLKRGYNKLVANTIEENLGKARAEKEEILRRQREDEAERLAYRSKSNLTNTDHFHRKQAVDEAEKVIEKVNQMITFKEVYYEIAKFSNKYYRAINQEKIKDAQDKVQKEKDKQKELKEKEKAQKEKERKVVDNLATDEKEKANLRELERCKVFLQFTDDNRLNAIKLSVWLQNHTLFGMERACSASSAQEAVRGLEFNALGIITLDSFKRWYENDVSAGSDLTGKTYFAKLLYENMSIDQVGQSGGAGSKNEEVIIEEEYDVKLGADSYSKVTKSKTITDQVLSGAKGIRRVGKAVSKFTRRVSGLFTLAAFGNEQKNSKSTTASGLTTADGTEDNIQLAQIRLEKVADINSGSSLNDDINNNNNKSELVEQYDDDSDNDENESEEDDDDEGSEDDSEEDDDDGSDEDDSEEDGDEGSDENDSEEDGDKGSDEDF